jgi:hypothetical protein
VISSSAIRARSYAFANGVTDDLVKQTGVRQWETQRRDGDGARTFEPAFCALRRHDGGAHWCVHGVSQTRTELALESTRRPPIDESRHVQRERLTVPTDVRRAPLHRPSA